MSFLHPIMLVGLPVVALPILIHLMNQRRFQTVEWGAMVFLLAASRMSRGFARIRRWLILAARTMVVLGLILAAARPLSSGWLGWAVGSDTDTTLILLDRSPSMSGRDKSNVASKLSTGVGRLADALSKLDSQHWVLIDGATNRPVALESPGDLRLAISAEPTSASADLPTMLQAAFEYIQTNNAGRTDIWICSDLRQHDWDYEGGRWSGLRDSFLELPQSVRFFLLAFSDRVEENRSVRVTSVSRRASQESSELLVSLEVRRDGDQVKSETVPLEFDIEGARSVVSIEINGPVFELVDHSIPLGQDQVRGWGKVALPSDANPADNDFYFVFDRQPPRNTLIVAEDPGSSTGTGIGALQLAAEIAPVSSLEAAAETISPSQLDAVVWDQLGLVIWNAPLPDAADALLLQSFVDADGQVIFLPPAVPDGARCFDFSWGSWSALPEEASIAEWRGDADLLARTLDGAALPVGELTVHRVCEINGSVIPLASFRDGRPLLGRAPTDRGGVYIVATTPALTDSSLARDGVVLYVLIQRALSEGAARLAGAQQLEAGVGNHDSSHWQTLASSAEALSNQRQFHAGVYGEGDQLLAVNRLVAEDQGLALSDQQVEDLFGELPLVRLEGQAGATSSLLQEVWKLMLVAMLVAMVAEALLCFPRRRAEGAFA